MGCGLAELAAPCKGQQVGTARTALPEKEARTERTANRGKKANRENPALTSCLPYPLRAFSLGLITAISPTRTASASRGRKAIPAHKANKGRKVSPARKGKRGTKAPPPALSDAVDSDSTTTAASSKAVKSAYDKADAASKNTLNATKWNGSGKVISSEAPSGTPEDGDMWFEYIH